MVFAPVIGAATRRLLAWVALIELLVAPPATGSIVVWLTWRTGRNASEDFDAIITASVLTPLAALLYLVGQAILLIGVMIMVMGAVAGAKLADMLLAGYRAKQRKKVLDELLDDPESREKILDNPKLLEEAAERYYARPGRNRRPRRNLRRTVSDSAH